MANNTNNVTRIDRGERFNLTQQETRDRVEAGLKRRYRMEQRFRAYGMVSIVIGIVFLGFLFWTIIGNGAGAFRQTKILLDIEFSADNCYLLQPDPKDAHFCHLKCAKRRYGEPQDIGLYFNRAIQSFEDPDETGIITDGFQP